MKGFKAVLVSVLIMCLLSWPALAENYQQGDELLFGHYEQNNNLSNGSEPIAWVVLDVQDDRMFLISQFCLDAKPYNQQYADVTWEECTLRAWLNNDFLNEAFSAEEQEAILLSEVDNRPGDDFEKEGVHDTWDRVFLLNRAEYQRFMANKAWEAGTPTAFAKANGGYTYHGHCSYWLRSRYPSVSPYLANAQSGGEILIVDSGMALPYVHHKDKCVRPAMWVSLNAPVAEAENDNADDATHANDARVGRKFRITANSARGRSGPGTEYDLVKTFKFGDTHTVLAVAYAANGIEWYRLDVGESAGVCWVSSGLGVVE